MSSGRHPKNAGAFRKMPPAWLAVSGRRRVRARHGTKRAWFSSAALRAERRAGTLSTFVGSEIRRKRAQSLSNDGGRDSLRRPPP